MTASAESVLYSFHGVGVEVCAPAPAVREAIDLRLRPYRTPPLPEAPSVELRLQFVADEPAEPPDGDGRPVYDTPDGSLHYFPAIDALYGQLGDVTLRCEPAHGRARLQVSGEFSGRRLYLATHPLVTISLMERLRRHGMFSLHAGSLASGAGDGVLLAGASGAGKSTLALALARAGMEFLSDDVIFLSRGDDQIRALGFADTIGITEATATRFAAVHHRLPERPAWGFPKRLGRVEDLFDARIARTCTPRVIVFPRVAPDQPSRLEPLDSGAALLRLVPDVLLTEPSLTQAHLAAIGALLDQVSCYELQSGADLERAAALVEDLV